MDIYLEILAELAIEQLSFDEDDICNFEIQSAENKDTDPFIVNIIRDNQAMALGICVTTASELPQQISPELFTLFGKHAMGPMRGDSGVGILPNTNKVSAYTRLLLSDYREGQLKEALSELIEKAQVWETALTTKQQAKQSTPRDFSESSNLRV